VQASGKHLRIGVPSTALLSVAPGLIVPFSWLCREEAPLARLEGKPSAQAHGQKQSDQGEGPAGNPVGEPRGVLNGKRRHLGLAAGFDGGLVAAVDLEAAGLFEDGEGSALSVDRAVGLAEGEKNLSFKLARSARVGDCLCLFQVLESGARSVGAKSKLPTAKAKQEAKPPVRVPLDYRVSNLLKRLLC
jgi:hypothetical protein